MRCVLISVLPPEIKNHCGFRYLKFSVLYPQRKQVRFHGVRHVVPPCFYSSPKKDKPSTVSKEGILHF